MRHNPTPTGRGGQKSPHRGVVAGGHQGHLINKESVHHTLVFGFLKLRNFHDAVKGNATADSLRVCNHAPAAMREDHSAHSRGEYVTHIGVGFCVAALTASGNAKASRSGTSQQCRLSRFSYIHINTPIIQQVGESRAAQTHNAYATFATLLGAQTCVMGRAYHHGPRGRESAKRNVL